MSFFTVVLEVLESVGQADRMEGISKEHLSDVLFVLTEVEKQARNKALRGKNFLWLEEFGKSKRTDSPFLCETRVHLRKELAILEAVHQLDLCKSLSTYAKQSGANSQLDERLQSPPDTRWNAKCPMLRSVSKFIEKAKRSDSRTDAGTGGEPQEVPEPESRAVAETVADDKRESLLESKTETESEIESEPEYDSADSETATGTQERSQTSVRSSKSKDSPQERLKKQAQRVDKEAVDSLLNFLQMFEEETLWLEGQNYPTLPFAVLSYSRLLDGCQPEETDSLMIRRVKERCREELTKRFVLDDWHKLGTFLWPQFRTLRMLPEDERYRIWDLARSKCAALEPEPASDQEGPVAKRARTGMTHYAKYSDATSSCRPLDEVTRYLNDVNISEVKPKVILLFWEKATGFPNLRRLAKVVMSIPATSAPSERAFSIAGHLYSKRRALLDPATVDNSLFYCSFLRNNKKQ